MINQFIFSVCSHVQIQGEDILQVVYRDSEVATYKLAGFEDHPVIIEDYRSFGLEALNAFLRDGHSYDFRSKFNCPSNVLFFKGDDGDILIQLMETKQKDPPYMLWIATGTENTLPASPSYLFRDISQYANNKQAFLSLHKQLYRRNIRADYQSSPKPVLQTRILEMDALGQ